MRTSCAYSNFTKTRASRFYSLQYVDGADLGVLTGQGPWTRVLPPLGLIADALRYAHGKDIVHRDVKASNILLDHNGVPYLSDFGVAARAGAAAAGGSPVAASPQSLAGQAAQPADDIFALGTLLYELVSGGPPWPPAADPAPLQAACGEAIPGAIQDLMARMLDKDAGGRPDAGEVSRVLCEAGFAPGPTRSRITARPVLGDERIESVAAVRPPRKTAELAAASGSTGSGAGISARTLLIALAVMLGVLLGVVFLLPDAVEDSQRSVQESAVPPSVETPGDSRVEADTPATRDEPPIDRVTRDYDPENVALDGETIEFNENDADFSGLDDDGKLRFNVEMILGELLSDFETLEKRSVQRWAQVPYRRAKELYAEGDAAFLKRDWAAAEVTTSMRFRFSNPCSTRSNRSFRRRWPAPRPLSMRGPDGGAATL